MPIHKNVLTSEFNLAAFLFAKKCHLHKLDRSNPKRVLFCFEDVPTEIVDDYWGNGEVSVSDFVSAQKTLKQRLFSDVY